MSRPNDNLARSTELSLEEKKRLLLQLKLQGKVDCDPQPESEALPRDPTQADLPISAGELSLWTAHSISDYASAYNLVSAFRVYGSVEVDLLQAAFQHAVNRHENLRSYYQHGEHRPIKRLSDDPPPKLLTRRLDGEAALMESAEEFARQPFDLDRPPLLRLALFSADERNHVLALSIHHIISDEWSVSLFWKEICSFYQHRQTETPRQLEAAPPSYSEFLHKQRNSRTSRDEAYWERRLANSPPPLNLPTDFPYPSRTCQRGALQTRELSPKTSESLSYFLDSSKAPSPFLTLSFAYYLLLRKLCQQDDIVIGLPVANRPTRESESIIGYFLEALPMRFQFKGDDLVKDALADLKTQFLEALEHRDVSLESLIKKTASPRPAGSHPLFQSLFVYQGESNASGSIALGDCQVKPIQLDLHASKFDLTLFVVRSGEGLRVLVEYRTDLFKESTIDRIIDRYESVLLNLIHGADNTLDAVNRVSEPELETLLSFESGPALEPTGHTSVLDLIFGKEIDPKAAAIVAQDATLSYETLSLSSQTLASNLMARGVARGETVAVLGYRNSKTLLTLLGIMRAGCAYLPIEPEQPVARIQELLENARASLLIDTSDSPDSLEIAAVRSVAFDDLLTTTKELSGDSLPQVKSEDAAYFIYTSGSTGRPKAVTITHANLLHSTRSRLRFYRASPGKFLLLSSFAFDSSVAGIFWTLCSGGALVIPSYEDSRDPERIIELVSKHQIQTSLCIPSLHRHILEWSDARLRSLRALILAGEACPPGLASSHFRKHPDCRLFNEYGPSEATVWATVHEIDRQPVERVPIGKPIPGYAVRLLDPQGKRVGIGERGELHIAGPGLSPGYLNEESLTQQRFKIASDGARLYATGDFARWNVDGTLDFLGRNDGQVKVRGHRVEIGEIETRLLALAGVAEAVVIAKDASANVGSSSHSLEELIAMLPETTVNSEIAKLLAKEDAADVLKRREEAEFQVTLGLKSSSFVSPPRKAQRDWMLGQLMNEFADDLKHLDVVSRSFVAGKNHDLSEGVRNLESETLSEREFMEEWQRPLMETMARIAAENRGDVLEIGFGRGVSARYIQSHRPLSHTVIEMNQSSIEQHFQPWRETIPNAEISLHQGRWQDVLPALGSFDGILFHTYPMNEKEFVDYILNSITFAEHAFKDMAEHLKPGGVFTYLSTEIDSLSRRHQRALFKHFSEISMQVVSVDPPHDTQDSWWAKSMVAVRAVK